MDKCLILLGIALIASLPFAVEEDGGPENWMQLVQGRYSCAFDYDYSLFFFAWEMCGMDSVQLGYYLNGEGDQDGLDDFVYYMGIDAGCELPDPSPAAFRPDMMGFNTLNYQFKSRFLSMMRGCIAGTEYCECDREDIISMLSAYYSSYLGCVSERPYCRFLH